jgi:WD40 repeat protein
MCGTRQAEFAGAVLLAFLGAAALPGGASLRADEPSPGGAWQEHAVLKGNPNGVSAVAFAPDGTSLATLSLDRVVKVWDLAKAKEQATLKSGKVQIMGIAYAGGKALLTVGEDATVRQWDPASGRERSRVRLGLRDMVLAAAFSPDGKLLATSAGNMAERRPEGEVQLWDAATGKKRGVLPGRAAAMYRAVFAPDGKTLVTLGETYSSTGVNGELNLPEGEAKVWDPGKNKERLTVAKATSAAFAPDGKTLAVTGWEDRRPKRVGVVKLLETATLKERLTIRGHEGSVTDAAFSPDGKLLATVGEDKLVRLWDVDTGKEQASLKGHRDAVLFVTFSADGKLLATAGTEGVVHLWAPKP